MTDMIWGGRRGSHFGEFTAYTITVNDQDVGNVTLLPAQWRDFAARLGLAAVEIQEGVWRSEP